MRKKVLSLYDQNVGLNLSLIVTCVLLGAIIILGYFYYHGNLDDHTTVLYGGVIASFIAVVIQFLFDWNEHREIEKMKGLGIHQILPNRSDKNWYDDVIRNATQSLDMMGVTASRFLKDFADQAVPTNNALHAAFLNPNFKVRFLLASHAHLETAEERSNAVIAEVQLQALTSQYAGRFNYKFYHHPAAHSILVVDDEAIIGPVFPGVSSKHTPSMHASKKSMYVNPYLKYYEEEWQNARTTP